MYKYDLINNHYLVLIDGRRYLVDTGSESSFSLDDSLKSVTIDGVSYHLQPNRLSVQQKRETFEMVGTTFDGFVGMDIIRATSLTIYKNGDIDFKANDAKEGTRIPMHDVFSYIYIMSDDGKYLIDTGAKYAYGTKEKLSYLTPSCWVDDYNPGLGHLHSQAYQKSFKVGNKLAFIWTCKNEMVENTYLMMTGVSFVGNITKFFDEVCVLDIQNRLLIVK